MESAWFCVTCMVDNGCTVEKWESLVCAFTASQAKFNVVRHWNNQDSETVAKVISCRKVDETELFDRRVYG